MLAAIARRHRAFVVMVNQVGGNDSLVFDGSSIVLAPMAKSSPRPHPSPKT
jgi:NAD+ synthase (glutamine-hydrolysing)